MLAQSWSSASHFAAAIANCPSACDCVLVQAVQEVARKISSRSNIQLIVDPVMVATCGDSLATSEVAAAMIE